MEKIGWIGTGVMGSAIVRRLLSQGVPVMVFNRTVEKARALFVDGAELASSPAQLAGECSIIFLCLIGHEAIEAMIFDRESGIVANARPDSCVINASTISPAFAITLSDRARAVGIDYVDAPVSGGPENARLGRLACILSGPQERVERLRDLIATFTASVHYVGKAGNAQLIKVLNNLAESINLIGAAEVFSIGLKAGIDLETMQSVLPTMRGYSTYMGVLLDRLLHPREDISFSVAARLKDLRLAHQVASDYAVPILAGALAEQLFVLTLQREGPAADQTSCIKLYESD